MCVGHFWDIMGVCKQNLSCPSLCLSTIPPTHHPSPTLGCFPTWPEQQGVSTRFFLLMSHCWNVTEVHRHSSSSRTLPPHCPSYPPPPPYPRVFPCLSYLNSRVFQPVVVFTVCVSHRWDIVGVCKVSLTLPNPVPPTHHPTPVSLLPTTPPPGFFPAYLTWTAGCFNQVLSSFCVLVIVGISWK